MASTPKKRKHVTLTVFQKCEILDHIKEGAIFMEKAKYFHERLGQGEFSASKGWLEKFKKRHGIRQLKITDEKLSKNEDAVKPFQDKFMDIIKEKDLSAEQIYNADEPGL
ncbi:unnamed protein product [Parnassius apollo]|uniref:(apollo) hypothetical protein n=1 Tax=Parnassius apollo TaxID=110799 RepID=A0A8S3XSB6_PARAO|nr:unnamed protein product [Parnassius apollo]